MLLSLYCFIKFILIIEQKFGIFNLGTFDVSVVLQSLERKEGYNEEKNFYCKSPSAYCYHFITPYLTGNSNKNMTL